MLGIASSVVWEDDLREAFPFLPRPVIVPSEALEATFRCLDGATKRWHGDVCGSLLWHCWYVGHLPGHVRRQSTWPQDVSDGGEFILLGDRCICAQHSLQWTVRHLEGLIPALQRLAPLGWDGQRLGQ